MAASMKVSEFMMNLHKTLIETRKVTESTATQYLQTLFSLNGKKSFNNLAWTKKKEQIQEIIDTYAKSTQLNQYSVLSSVLALCADKATYKPIYNYWKDKMLSYKKELAGSIVPFEKSDKQEENWITSEEVNKKKLELKTDVSSFASTKSISAKQYDTLLQFIVISLYTDIPPRRNQDFLDMYIVKKLPQNAENNRNYYDVASGRFIFNKYKTAKTYGQQIIEVPKELKEALDILIKFHPLSKNKSKEIKMLAKYDGSEFVSVNSITRILNKIFNKKVGSSMLRHVYLSDKYGDVIQDQERDAAMMGHSVSEAVGTYIKED